MEQILEIINSWSDEEQEKVFAYLSEKHLQESGYEG